MHSTEEEVQISLKQTGYISPNRLKSRLGGATQLDVFVKHNQHLDSVMFRGIYCHLVQDCLYDDFVRNNLKVSNNHNALNYKINNNDYTNDEITQLLSDMGVQETLILANSLYDMHNITYNNEWLKENVEPILYSEYPEDLANTTLSYIYLPKELNTSISNHEFNLVSNTFIPFENYTNLYKIELEDTSKIYRAKGKYCVMY